MTEKTAIFKSDGKETPIGWQISRLGDVCEIIAGQSPPGSTYRDKPEGLPFFQGKADFGLIHPVARAWCVEPKKIALPGDILISVRAPVGPTNVANVKCCIGRGLSAIRCRGEVDGDFILYTLRMFEAELVAKGAGSTFQAIKRNDLEKYEIPIPPFTEQKRIARILNEQMAAVEQAKKAAEEQKEAGSAIYDSFVREALNSEKANSWPKINLLDLCERPGQYGTSKKSNFHKQGIPVLGMYHIHEGRIRWDNVFHIELENNEKEKYLVQQGDLLFNRTNSAELVGKTAVFDLDREAVFASYLVRFQIKSDLADPHFISAYINSEHGRSFIERNMTRAIGQVNISASTMHGMPVPSPKIKIQRKIGRILRERQNQISGLQNHLNQEYKAISAMPRSILRRAFAGEI